MKRFNQSLPLNSSQINYLLDTAYNSTKVNAPKGMVYNNGASALDRYLTANTMTIRPMEAATAFGISYPAIIEYSDRYDYKFACENATTASATRRVMLFIHDKKLGTHSCPGFITLTLGSATAHTIRDYKVDYKYKSATGSASGTAVTLSAGTPVTAGFAVGARIGWGATKNDVTTWYRISAIGSDTAVTLATSAGTISSSQCWIEEFRQIYIGTNATTTNGGIHVAKGISLEDFTPVGTAIALASATDNLKAVYWCKDAVTQTNLVSCGSAIDYAGATDNSLICYVIDLVSAGNYKFYKYNLRAALTVSAGITTNTFIEATGNNAFTGNGVNNANLCIATAGHGTGSGVKSLYFVTSTRVYRIPVTAITSGNTAVLAAGDSIVETPMGGVNTYPILGAFSTIEYLSSIDKFVISQLAGNTSAYCAITNYYSSGVSFDKKFGILDSFLDQSTKDSGRPSGLKFNPSNGNLSFTDTTDYLYISSNAVTTAACQVHVLPHANDWDYASTQNKRLIFPKISTPNASKYYSIFKQLVDFIGSNNLGKSAEPVRLQFRTTNIDANITDGWADVDSNGDVSSYGGEAYVQIAILPRILGDTCIPARIYGVGVLFEDNNSVENFRFSALKSSGASKIFAFRFAAAFGTTVPHLEIDLYDDVTNGLLHYEFTNPAEDPIGTWEQSTNGGTSWAAFDGTDKVNETHYIRYTPNSLADNVNIRPVLKLR